MSMLEASPERAARDAATKLGSLVTDLDLMITYQAASPAPRTTSAWLPRSRRNRTPCAGNTPISTSLASGQTALLDEVRTDYEQRIATLTRLAAADLEVVRPDTPRNPAHRLGNESHGTHERALPLCRYSDRLIAP